VGFLVLVVVAAAVIVLVVRAAGAQNGSRTTGRPARRPRPRRPQQVTRPVAPDDDPEFLRSLDHWTRRDDGAAS
jgi:hypothetical protein